MEIPNRPGAHLAYCTNIHPAESWQETWHALKKHTLEVRNRVLTPASCCPPPAYAIGLRLSAQAASELLEHDNLRRFKIWLEKENCYVFTINGFPYGAFHGTRVKEKVFQPDWTEQARLDYTLQLFEIIARLVPEGVEGSVSTLPGSHKTFSADEAAMFAHLESCARKIEELSAAHNRDLHLGLEPEPLGHFENREETLGFFKRFLAAADDPGLIRRRIGINYDACHFALEFDDCHKTLDALLAAGLRISKVHLSSALEFDPYDQQALAVIRQFDEPTYFHQVVVLDDDGHLTRHADLPDFLATWKGNPPARPDAVAARVHFHIPLYAEPDAPLKSTQFHARDIFSYLAKHPGFCRHFEIETYTWAVLPGTLQTPVEEQIAKEYAWVLRSV